MSDTSASTPCACNASVCCEGRLARLEKRVCWIRTGLLIALGVLLLLIGIGIGKGGAREQMRERAIGMMHRRAMMRGDMGPGPGADRRGPVGMEGAERGPDAERRGPRNRN